MSAERISLVSVNVGLPKIIGTVHGEPVLSGIDKHAVTADEVFVGATNIAGDGQADLEAHGGLDKAVYAYPSDHWPWWTREKTLPCAPATFGENLTLAGADENEVRIGERFRWGGVLLEICQPRAPCFKLAIHTKRPDVPQAVTLSAFSGWYLRVIEEGIAPVRGATLVRVAPGNGPSVREAFVALFSTAYDLDTLRRIHAAPALSEAWRQALERKIAAFRG